MQMTPCDHVELLNTQMNQSFDFLIPILRNLSAREKVRFSWLDITPREPLTANPHLYYSIWGKIQALLRHLGRARESHCCRLHLLRAHFAAPGHLCKLHHRVFGDATAEQMPCRLL